MQHSDVSFDYSVPVWNIGATCYIDILLDLRWQFSWNHIVWYISSCTLTWTAILWICVCNIVVMLPWFWLKMSMSLLFSVTISSYVNVGMLLTTIAYSIQSLWKCNTSSIWVFLIVNDSGFFQLFTLPLDGSLNTPFVGIHCIYWQITNFFDKT